MGGAYIERDAEISRSARGEVRFAQSHHASRFGLYWGASSDEEFLVRLHRGAKFRRIHTTQSPTEGCVGR